MSCAWEVFCYPLKVKSCQSCIEVLKKQRYSISIPMDYNGQQQRYSWLGWLAHLGEALSCSGLEMAASDDRYLLHVVNFTLFSLTIQQIYVELSMQIN